MEYNPYLIEQEEYALQALQKKALDLKASEKPLINLTVGDPLDDTFEPIKEKIISEISQMSYSQYPSPYGSKEYLEAVANWAKRNYTLELDPQKEILSCNGTKEAIFMIPLLLDFKKSTKKIFIPSLSYPVYEASAGLLGIQTKTLKLTKESDFLPDLDILTDEEWKSCGLFWINSPHNPTTATASHAYLEKLLQKAETYNFLVCSDECYTDLYYKSQPASCLHFKENKHWLVFRSLSKRSHMTGFRVGALISKNIELMGYLKKMRSSMGVGTPTFIQKAAISAWNDMKHPQENASLYKEKKELLQPILEKKGFEIFKAESTFYFWMSHKKGYSSKELSDHFLKSGILITPGTVFGKDGEGYIRMVYCVTKESILEVKRRIEEMEL